MQSPPSSTLPPLQHFINDMENHLLSHQEAIELVTLAAYAVAAMRVLMMFEQQANVSADFDNLLRAACPDWRNPGSIDHPADLIAVGLVQAMLSLQKIHAQMQQTMERLPQSPGESSFRPES